LYSVAEISLAVTKAVLAYATGAREKERQIAYTQATADIAPRLAEVGARHRLTLRLGDCLTLVVAGRGAMWRAHNDQQLGDFDAPFEFLAKYPSQLVRFVCEIVE
jgi:hypothetical protein